MGRIENHNILDAEDTQGEASAIFHPASPEWTIQATGRTSVGAGTAVITVMGSNKEIAAGAEYDSVAWVTIGTISLILSTTDSADGFASVSSWRHVVAVVTTLTGTGAEVDVDVGHAIK